MTAATPTTAVSEQTVEVAGLDIALREGGSGPPLLLLHRSTGYVEWGAIEDALAANYRVIVPDLPGFGRSERPDWAREPRDLAVLMQRLIERLDLEGVTLVGLGFGGFIAAEMAAINESRLSSLVLVGAAGLKPREGEILDQMLIPFQEYIAAGLNDESSFETHFGEEVHPDIKDIWEFSRIMTARVTWSPYMYSRQLRHLLGEVRTPALVVWGDNDRVVPLVCGEQYAEALSNARLDTVASCGHRVELEQPEALASLIAGTAGS
jgi:pimeloyl-ACP methyl ester carboxylesterase